MSHFTVTVCLPAGTPIDDIEDVLADVLERWNENRSVEPYRVYEDGGPESYWWVSSIRRGAQEHHEDAPVEIRESMFAGDGKVWRNGHGAITKDEYIRLQKEHRADDAIWAERLGDNPTWETVATLYNEKWGHGSALAVPGDDTDSERLYYDPETGRAYNISTRNPESMWDYWRIGGRWREHFIVNARGGYAQIVDGEPQRVIITSKLGWDSPKPKDGPIRCDGGPRHLLDFDAMRDEAADEANDLFDAWEKICADTPHAQPWQHFTGLVDVGEMSIEQARKDYWAQPRVQAVRNSEDDRLKWMADAVEKFGVGREEYVRLERLNAVPGYALITLNGEWLAPGRMGWFGMSSDSPGEKEAFKVGANRYLDELPGDAVIVQIDCHI